MVITNHQPCVLGHARHGIYSVVRLLSLGAFPRLAKVFVNLVFLTFPHDASVQKEQHAFGEYELLKGPGQLNRFFGIDAKLPRFLSIRSFLEGANSKKT